jgi:hypothetical protein
MMKRWKVYNLVYLLSDCVVAPAFLGVGGLGLHWIMLALDSFFFSLCV